MSRRPIDEHDIERFFVMATQLSQKHRETLAVQVGHLKEEILSRSRFDGAIEPVIFIKGLQRLLRFDAFVGQAPITRQMKSKAALILTKQTNDLVGLRAAKRDD